jgi:ketosteroid isomerase-like protein
MSSETTMPNPIETVQAIYAAFGRGDIPFILSQLDESVVWEFEAPASLGFSGIRRGPKEVVGFFEGIGNEHADPKVTISDVFGSGDKVAAFGRYDVTMKATGKPVSSPLAHFWTFHNGKVTRYVNYINSAAFVEASS